MKLQTENCEVLSTEFTYDGFSRRVKEVEKNSGGSVTSEKRYVWCGGTQPCEERNSSNTVVKRYYAQGEQVSAASSPADKLFYTRDHLGTVRELTDDNEAVRARYDYDPYGKRSVNLITSSPLETVVGYTGHHYHAKSNLTLTWYRAYDAELGRWLSRDPIAENGGINLYQYVANDPINWWDPNGLQAFSPGAFFPGNPLGSANKGVVQKMDNQAQATMDAAKKSAQIAIGADLAVVGVGVAIVGGPPATAAVTQCVRGVALNAANQALANPLATREVAGIVAGATIETATGAQLPPSPELPETTPGMIAEAVNAVKSFFGF